MITFVITKDDIEKTFICALEDSILSSLKNKIIQEFNIESNYIDLEFLLDRPIRSLGKLILNLVLFQDHLIVISLIDMV